MDDTNILIFKIMKPLYKFKIGSSIFFSEYSDYKIKDIDWVAIFDIFPFEGKQMMKDKIELFLDFYDFNLSSSLEH